MGIKFHLLSFFTVLCVLSAKAFDTDTSRLKIPISRQGFHDQIDKEQGVALRFNAKAEGKVTVSNDENINLQVTDALVRQVDALQEQIETDRSLDHRLKTKYLSGIIQMMKSYNHDRKYNKIDPGMAVQMVKGYQDLLNAQLKGRNIMDIINRMPYEVAEKLVGAFDENPGYQLAKITIFQKYAEAHLSDLLRWLNTARYREFANQPFIDTLVAKIARQDPIQVYDYAISSTTAGGVVRRNMDPVVRQIVAISKASGATKILPFLDDLIAGKISIDEIEKTMEDDDAYYKLLVKCAIGMQGRKLEGEQLLGLSYMMDNVKIRALKYIRQVNDLHEEKDPIRFKSVEGLSPQELYYLIINGQEEIYTSSFIGLFKRMMERMKPPKGDDLLVSVNFDRFKKFISMSAGYNTLDEFLQSMDPQNANALMEKYIANLESKEDLEDAVDVADSFGSIKDPKLLEFLRNEVRKNYELMQRWRNQKGSVIYGLLATLITDRGVNKDSTWSAQLSNDLHLPPINLVPFKDLVSDSGVVYYQVFFYGDKDGQDSYASFLTNFPGSEWRIAKSKYWVTISSLKGKPVTIFANLPLDEPEDKDAIDALGKYLEEKDIHPTVFIHRGHSYHVDVTLKNLQSTAKIVVLGSCGGYHSLKSVLDVSPDAQIISSKQVGTRLVNEPIIRAINDNIRSGHNLDWVKIWDGLSAKFQNDAHGRELFSDYIPPHKNLGAIFIKAYRQLTKDGK